MISEKSTTTPICACISSLRRKEVIIRKRRFSPSPAASLPYDKYTGRKCLCQCARSGILTPDSGTVLVDGRTPHRDRIAHVKEIGVVFGQRSQLWWDVPVIDSFELLKDIYTIPDNIYKKNLEELTGLLNLGELLRSPTRQLSLGQRMRCEIAASLLHSPRILFLDEPTIGLDAISKLAVRDFILRQNQLHGTTVILTTHDMQDIEALASRIILIGKGHILMDGTLEDIRRGGENIDETVAELYRSYDIAN